MKILSVSVALPTRSNPNTMAPVARQLESLRAIGIDVTSIQVSGSSKLKYPATMRRLYQEIASVDIVHAHYGYCGWLARCQIRRPLVVSFMGSDLLGIPGPDGRISRSSAAVVQLDRWFSRTADAVIVKSPEMADVLKPVSSHVVPNGVDTDLFRPMPIDEARAALGWPQEGLRVLFAGNPDNPRKGYPLAVETVAALKEYGVGEVDLVPLHGVAEDQVPLFMNACDAMIMASFLEGSPNVVKEAMACNLPVVSVPVGDVDILFSGVEHYSVRPRDPLQLAESIAHVMKEQELSTGREAIFSKGLDLESVALQLEAIYQEVLR